MPDTLPRSWWTTSAGFLGISISQVILSGTTDVVVVGGMLSTAEAGRYSIAMQLAGLIMLPVGAISTVVTPLIARHHYANERDELQRLLRFSARLMLMSAAPGVLLMLVFGRPILGLFGAEFTGAYPVLAVMTLAAIQGAAGGSIAGFVMTMTGHQQQATKIIFFSSAIYALLTVPMTLWLGAVGTASASLVAFLVRSVLLVTFIRKRIGLNVLAFGRASSASQTA